MTTVTVHFDAKSTPDGVWVREDNGDWRRVVKGPSRFPVGRKRLKYLVRCGSGAEAEGCRGVVQHAAMHGVCRMVEDIAENGPPKGWAT